MIDKYTFQSVIAQTWLKTYIGSTTRDDVGGRATLNLIVRQKTCPVPGNNFLTEFALLRLAVFAKISSKFIDSLDC